MTRCECGNKRPIGQCRQCYNRLVEKLKKSEEQLAIASRMYREVDHENDLLTLKNIELEKENKISQSFRSATTVN